MDAIELLEKDHATIRTLFSDIEKTQDSQELEENFTKLAKLLLPSWDKIISDESLLDKFLSG